MRRLLVALCLALALAAGWNLSPAPPTCKPEAPIAIEARLVGDPGAPFGIVAEASSPLDAEIELEIVLPDGVTALAGERAGRGKRVGLRLDAQSIDRSRKEILVRATLREGSARLTRVVPLVIHDAPPRHAPGVLKTNSRGERILEFDR